MTDRDIYGCELFDGHIDRDGYGREPSGRLAHIAAWERVNGPVPAGKTLDHACRRRCCRRIAHLEPVTKGIQESRKSWANRAAKKTCSRGHSMDTAVITPEGGRICRVCNKEEL